MTVLRFPLERVHARRAIGDVLRLARSAVCFVLLGFAVLFVAIFGMPRE